MEHWQQGIEENEPLWWGLFAAGGGIAALCMPAHIVLQSLLGAIGVPVATSSYKRTRRLLANPRVRIYLLALTSLSYFHWAHRFRYYAMDLGIRGGRRPIALVLYGSAIAMTLNAARTMLRRPLGKRRR